MRDPYIVVVVVVGWLPLGMSIRSIIRLILSQTYDVASITVATKDTLGLLYICHTASCRGKIPKLSALSYTSSL